MHAYLLLDRTGSMQTRWAEALGSVNGYVDELGKDPKTDDCVTLAVFDALEDLKFEVLRRKKHPSEWEPVGDHDASPRGNTPLFDAISRMVALAEQDAPEKAVIAIITDGLENASREVDREGARAALDRCEKRGWEVVFMGAQFKDFTDAEALGVASDKAMGYAAGSGVFTMRSLARKSHAYRDARTRMKFTEEDRRDANEDKA